MDLIPVQLCICREYVKIMMFFCYKKPGCLILTVILLHCVLSLAAQCIVIGPVCGFVCVCVCVCNNDNSKIIACIDLHQTGSVAEGSDHLQLINFGCPAPPGRGSAAGRNFWLCFTTASAQCLRLIERFFHLKIVFPDFSMYHNSPMEDRLSSSIRLGRPYRGTAVLIRNSIYRSHQLLATCPDICGVKCIF